MKLRSRLALAAAVLVIVVVAAGWTIVRVVPASQRDQADQLLRTSMVSAFGLARPGAPAPPPVEQPFVDVYIARVAVDGSRVPVLVAPSDVSQRVPATPALASRPDSTRIVTVGSVDGGPRWRAVLLQTPGPDRVLVAVSLQRADATADQVRLTVMIAGAAIVAALALGAWWLLRLGLRPIADVTNVADAITAGDRSRRVPVRDRRTEAGHLGRAINVMLDEQEAGEARLRRFLSDASHELRTPVAAIRGFADLYRVGALDDPDVLADVMRRIGGESSRMAGLVEDLLLLARLDEGRPLEAQRVDLTTVLRDAAFDASATHPDRVVRTAVDADLAVVGDDARLRQVVANVVHNALTHGGPDATVAVCGRRQGELCVVEVVDDGVGMDAEQAARAFDRFWRADAARTRHANGAGLGLAIVRAISEAHGGRVALDSSPGSGTTVRVVLPAA